MSIRGARRTMRVLILVTLMTGGTHPYGGRSPRVFPRGAKNAVISPKVSGTRVAVRLQYNLTGVKYFDCVITYFLSIINIDKNYDFA